MIDIKLAMAQEVSEQIGAVVCKEICSQCKCPLLEKPEQGFPFCWFCAADRTAAQRALTALTKAKMAAQGVFLKVDDHAHPALATKKLQYQSWGQRRSNDQ